MYNKPFNLRAKVKENFFELILYGNIDTRQMNMGLHVTGASSKSGFRRRGFDVLKGVAECMRKNRFLIALYNNLEGETTQ
jgi:hypothetical protein